MHSGGSTDLGPRTFASKCLAALRRLSIQSRKIKARDQIPPSRPADVTETATGPMRHRKWHGPGLLATSACVRRGHPQVVIRGHELVRHP